MVFVSTYVRHVNKNVNSMQVSIYKEAVMQASMYASQQEAAGYVRYLDICTVLK